jgi:xylulokinase
MSSRNVLGIDIGTTALKAIALEREKGIVAQTDIPHELLSLQSGWAEEDTERWWTTTLEAIRQLLTVIPAESIEAIGVSGMVPAMVILDAYGMPLRPSIQQNAARAITEVEELRAAVDFKEFLSITGCVPLNKVLIPSGVGSRNMNQRLLRMLRIFVVLMTSSFIV